MRALQPIARRTEAERNRNRWVPPPALRRIAWYILLGSVACEIIAGSRIALYVIRSQQDPTYALARILPHLGWAYPLLVVIAPTAIILCIPFVAIRPSRPKKKHVPDPALSIRPR
jgi:hypothetical protein